MYKDLMERMGPETVKEWKELGPASKARTMQEAVTLGLVMLGQDPQDIANKMTQLMVCSIQLFDEAVKMMERIWELEERLVSRNLSPN